MLDIARIRSETPGVEKVLHFNNAGSSLMPRPVYEAVKRVLDLENALGGYEVERQMAPELEAFYTEFAGLLNAKPHEVAWVENATRAWDMAFYGLPLQPGDRIITHASEYVSNYIALLQQAKRRGLEIDLCPSDESGQIDVVALERLIGPKTRLIALTHVPTQGGLVNPAEAVGRVAKAHGLFYLLDACQSVGQIDLDVQKIGCDILSGTGRKFLRGPRGTGFLWVSDRVIDQIEPPFADMRAADWTSDQGYTLAKGARRFENWETYVGGRVGLMAAVRYARALGLPAIEARVERLAADLRAGLSGLSGVSVRDLGVTRCGIVTFEKTGLAAKEIYEALRVQGINVSVSSHSSARLDFGARGLESLVRASVHYFNDEAEIARFLAAVEALK
ncbi:aminotransferase class V-fold PLP-dependent enzyme [Falsigemmobacter faecalis]|uniref:Aminotransferase class V-fold PLP-dependent enzyme n=1 Tax=Falsigemmobacter faecalis TaxID=2488730 RepID=A0A3P3DI86_9RHOB|nr:aminotransferase class V-fold PLP-dependent enzyme [Falsigemmobacter faecalis]RRH73923.1 aminotransferase class V-fold PLP-dependent enzyme [Falsigemmobacter faecalis]